MRRFRIYAAERNQSITNLIEDAILNLVDENRKPGKQNRVFWSASALIAEPEG